MEFTAFAVDELGLTNAKSNAASSPIDLVGSDFSEGVPADAADPIVIDTSGNGLSFVSQVDGVDVDINADGFTETLGWLDGVDDAFLVMLQEVSIDVPVVPEGGIINGDNLITEYLVSPSTTDALADLRSIDSDSNNDGWISKDELKDYSVEKVPYLWFDDGDGLVSSSELAFVSEDFALNLSSFDDNVIVTSSGTVIAASQTEAGNILGTFTKIEVWCFNLV